MPELKATRDGYGEALVELGRTNRDVVVLCSDLTDSTRTNWFKEKFPDRFFELGIAEQDMMNTAAGLSLAGKIPFASTFGVFASGRAWEQVRITICYANLNVKIGGSHGGLTVGADGATHQALEEIALMRIIPNMKVLVPCDAIETYKATMAAAETFGPVYLRFGREKVPTITKPDTPFTIGKAYIMLNGKDLSIIGCGQMVSEALKAAQALADQGISVRVINLHTVKPIDEEAICQAAHETGALVTAEEHQVMGGMGSAVAEVVVKNCPVPMEMVGIQDRFGESGSASELLKAFGLTDLDIIRAAKKVLERKY